MIIYMVTNKTNGKQYIGQTIHDLEQRKVGHMKIVKSKKGVSYFHNTIRKYGPDNFKWEILHNNITNTDDLNKLEIYYIGLYDTYENGYNLTLGGGGTSGWKVTDEVKGKISRSMSGENHPNYGRKMPEGQKQKASKSMKGRFTGKDNPNYGKKASAETLRKMSVGRSGKCTGKDHPLYGKHHTKETKRRMSEGGKGKHIGNNNARCTPVIIDGKYFKSALEAARIIGVGSSSTIHRRIKRQESGYYYAKNI